jgi:hypothetical protein
MSGKSVMVPNFFRVLRLSKDFGKVFNMLVR